MDQVGHEDHAGVLADQKPIRAVFLYSFASEGGSFLMYAATVEDAIVKKPSFSKQRGKGF